MNINSEIQSKPARSARPSSSKVSQRSPYIHWIHCNICYEQYMHKRRMFYLLACDHVTCQQCSVEVKETAVNGPTIFKCPLCRQQTRACKMGNDMPAHLKELFHPEPYLDGLNTYRVMMFQEKHRRRFLDYLDREYLAIQENKICTQKLREQVKRDYQDLVMAKAERKRLEKRVILVKKQRKEMEEKRNVQYSSNSISNSSSSHEMTTDLLTKMPLQGPRMSKPIRPVVKTSGVTTFSPRAPNHSFLL